MIRIHLMRAAAGALLGAALCATPARAQLRAELFPYAGFGSGADEGGGPMAGLQVGVPAFWCLVPFVAVESWSSGSPCEEGGCVFDQAVVSAGVEARSPRLLVLRYVAGASVGVSSGDGLGAARTWSLGAETAVARTWAGRFLFQRRDLDEDGEVWSALFGVRVDVGVPGT